MSDSAIWLDRLHAINARSAFNTWAGFELVRAADGVAEIAIAARPELRQHADVLHAGVTGALIDTACGFAAVTVVGSSVVTSQYQVTLYAPANGTRFLVRAKVVKAGRRQIFTTAEFFDVSDGSERIIAGGSAVLIPLPPT